MKARKMIPVADMEIRAEYTGQNPNLKPAASAFARMIKKITNPDGTFTDPELEAEYQEWLQKEAAGCCNNRRLKGSDH